METLETTKNDAVPITGLVWSCKFASLEEKEEEEEAVACLASISTTENRKEGRSEEDGVDQ